MRYIILLLISLLTASAAQAQSYTNSTPITIPAGAPGATSGAASPYPSEIMVSGLSGTVTKATVTLTNINHTFPDDIDILLVGPTGAKALLMSDTGGSGDLANVTLTFDDAAMSELPDSTQIVSGTYRLTDSDSNGDDVLFPAPAPAGPYSSLLTAFNNTDPNGTWSLYVFDDGTNDGGSIAGGWTLNLTVRAPSAASVSISGRVLTNNRRGLSNALVYLTDSEGSTRTARTTSLGYYRFDDIAAGQSVTVTVVSKRYQFAPQIINLNEEMNGVNFLADN